jgi:serine/threonine protein phosphatase 1
MQNKHSRVKRFPINTLGRDFIVGDIHGAYDAVFSAMKMVKFNPQFDRIFSVGDLIDRGVQSVRCAEFLALPYVHAVRGNHDQNLLDLYANGEPEPAALAYMVRAMSMQWWLETSAADRKNILSLFSQLPIVIEIETERGLVGVVHGDVPKHMGWSAFVKLIEHGSEKITGIALWGRDRINNNDCTGVPGIGRVFMGHTIQRDGAARYGNVYAMDTGAVLNEISDKEGFALTLANIACGTMVFTNPADGVLPKINLKPDAVTNASFGNYVVKT